MHLGLQPTLQNDLVILKPLNERDYIPLYKVASDPLIWSQHPCNDRYQEITFEKFFDESIKSKGALIVIDRRSNEIIGSTRFNRLSTTDTAIEIGWSFLSRTYWGGHYNKAVKYLMIEYAFSAIEDIIFYIDKNNFRSQKAVEKIGSQHVSGDTLRHLHSSNPNNMTYRISKIEWLK
jgi:RimJ/RimL family protein N-acetyltransferase